MANQIYDKRLPSSNTIKKIIDEESLVGQYLAEAKAELDAIKTKELLVDTQKLRENIDRIIEKRQISKEKIDSLYNQRNLLYENLLSAIIGKYYAKNIIKNTEKFKGNKKTLNILDPSRQNSELQDLINEMTDALTLLIDTPENNKTQRQVLIDKIKILAEKLEFLFDQVKSNMNLDNISIDENGKLKGLGHVYNFTKDFATGTVEFFKINEKTNKQEQLPDDYDLTNFGEDKINAKVDIELLKDILIQDGSEANPYLIYNLNDFETFLESDRDVYFRLMTDLSISKSKVTIASNLDGNGHTLRFNKSCKRINFTGSISGTLNVIATASWFPLPFFLIPIFLKLQIKFGMMAYFKDGAKLNIYLDLGSTVSLEPIIHPGRFIKFITVGTAINDYADQIEFFFYGEKFKNSSYKISSKDYQDDPIEGRHLTKKTSNFDCLTIKKVSSLEFQTENESQNTILEKGTKMTLEGVLALSNGMNIIRANDEAEDDEKGTNRVSYYHDGKSYIADLSLFKHTYNDDNGLPHDYYPFKTITSVNLNRFTESNSLDGAGMIKLLSSLALIIILKNLTEEKLQNRPTTPQEALDVLAIFKLTLETQIENLKISMDKYIDLIVGSIQTFQYVEEQRLATDPFYNSDFTQELTQQTSSIYGNLSQLITDEIEVDIETIFEKIEIQIKLFEQSTVDITIGLVESIILINKTIENYLLFFDISEDYGNKFLKILESTSNIIKSLNDLKLSEFVVVPYRTIRQFTTWRQSLSLYTNDGIYGLGQIFVGQEFGLNSVDADLSSKDSYSIILKYLVNDSLIRSYKKDLFLGENKKDSIFKYEELLEKDYKIIVHLDANYEKTNPILLEEIPELVIYDQLDLTNILNGIEFTCFPDENNIMHNSDVGNIIEMLFIEHLFKNKNNMLQRISNILSIFSKCDRTFRNLILEYHFKRVINKILNTKNIIKDMNKEALISDQDFMVMKKYATSDEDLHALRNLINKYIAVWILKDYIFYRAGGSMLKYLKPDAMMTFLYRKEIFNLNSETKEEAFQNLATAVKNIWNS